MNVTHISIQIASHDPERLGAFYREVLQLPEAPEMGPGAFKIGATDMLLLVDHSEVSGPTNEPARMLLDLHVEDIDAEHARLEKAGVKFTRDKGLEYWGGVISTFNDPDGNTVQLMQYKPELAVEEEPAGVA